MATDIELDTYPSGKPPAHKPDSSIEPDGTAGSEESQDSRDGTVAAWAWCSASIMSITALLMILFPRFLIFVASIEEETPPLTHLEIFLSAHFGLFLIAIAVTLILYIPSDSPIEPTRRRDSLGHPLLAPITLASLISSFLSYNTRTVGSLSLPVATLTGIIGLWGVWALMFESSSRVSKKTGADKRTSAFLFGNSNAASVKKKEWKRAQRS